MTKPRTPALAPPGSRRTPTGTRIAMGRKPTADIVAPAMYRDAGGERSQAWLVLTLVSASIALSLYDLYQLATLMAG